MTVLLWTVIAIAVALVLYAYAGYPALLALVGRRRERPPATADLPVISIVVPAYNEAHQMRSLLDSLLSIDYPAEKRQILVVSDASTDGTDEIVRELADRGIELLRMAERVGKTAAENASCAYLRGDVIINTDASTRMHPQAIRALVAQFADPTIGVASCRDVSVAHVDGDVNAGESGYVGYEMWVRDLETRAGGIVGASGCLYAIRAELHRSPLPEALSRDFAAALVAREHGLRAVSVSDALCYVPRASSLRREYRRKVRTFTRGVGTLVHKRHLLNPFRYGVFAWMLFSHKCCRWLVPWAGVLAFGALSAAAVTEPWARPIVGAGALLGALAYIGWVWPEETKSPRLLAVLAYLAAGNIAVLYACIRALRGDLSARWEPTRREAVGAR